MLDTQQQTDAVEATTQSPNRWMTLALGAAIAMVVWAAVLLGLAGVIVPVLVIGVLFLAFVPFLRGDRRWLGLGFAAFALVALLGNAAGVIDDLSNPESAPAFLLTLWATIGTAVAVSGGLGVLFRWPAPRLGRVGALAGGAFAVGAIISLSAAAATESQEPLASDVAVVTEKVQFQPAEIRVAAGEGLWFDNRDGIRHTFSIEDVYFDVELPALKSVRSDLDLPAGAYQVICRVPGHEAMTTTLIVEG